MHHLRGRPLARSSDRNAFVQLIGHKRFVLWPPNQTAKLCPFPRLHPLWHKSRAHFEGPDRVACPRYAASEARVVDVSPGDVLFIPPFFWHTVETLSPSLSLSTISRWPELYESMNAIYAYDYLWDELASYQARAFALRTFLARLMEKAHAPDLISNIIAQYEGLEHLFDAPSHAQQGSWKRGRARRHGRTPRRPDGGVAQSRRRRPAAPCGLDERGTPMCRWCLGRINLDLDYMFVSNLEALPPSIRAVLLPEIVEEFTAAALGPLETLSFWRRCFAAKPSPPWFLTQPGSAEHESLWELKADDPED